MKQERERLETQKISNKSFTEFPTYKDCFGFTVSSVSVFTAAGFVGFLWDGELRLGIGVLQMQRGKVRSGQRGRGSKEFMKKCWSRMEKEERESRW